MDCLKKILPYTFDFFGLAELQIMPKDAQAWKKPMLTRSLHSYGFEFKFFWSKHKKLKKCKNLGFFNFSDLFWMFTNGFRLWTIFFVQKNTFFRQNRKKVKIRWFFGNSENQLYLVTFGNDFFSFVLKLMSYGRLILRRVKLTNFENVYHGPVVLWRLYLLKITYKWEVLNPQPLD